MANKSKYKKEYCQQLIDHMAEGLSFDAFAGVLRVSNKTLYTWLDKHEDWAAAYELGKSANLLFWEKLGVDHATYRHKGVRLDPTNYTLQMRNRHGWTTKDKEEPKGDTNNYFVTMNEEDLDQEIAKAMKKLKIKG